MLCFNKRVDASEILDQPNIPASVVVASLRDLETVNRLLGGTHAILTHLAPIFKAAHHEIRILDLACGAGDVLRATVRMARAMKRPVTAIGVDLNEKAVEYARAHAHEMQEISWLKADAFQLPFTANEFDVVMTSTFTHHLEPERIVVLMKEMRRISRGMVVISDLVRSAVCRLAFILFASLTRFHPVSIHDGAISVLRAYRPSELAECANVANLTPFRIYRHRFCRMTLISPVAGEIHAA